MKLLASGKAIYRLKLLQVKRSLEKKQIFLYGPYPISAIGGGASFP